MSAKIEDFINKLPEGYANYIKISLDPFHDKNIKFEGAPTSRNASSVVLCLNQEQSIAADDFPAITEETWDAHVVMYPMINSAVVNWAREHQGITYTDSDPGAAWTMYPLTVHGVNSGRPTYTIDNYVNNIQTLGLDSSSLLNYTTGDPSNNGPGRRYLRIVGTSFEVVNESPEIYTQGSCTVYRYPLETEPQHRWLSVVTPTTSPVNPYNTTLPLANGIKSLIQTRVTEVRAPPTNQPTSVLIPGSQTWKAKEGAYVTATQYESEIPFKPATNSDLLFTGYTPTLGTKFTGLTSRYSFCADAVKEPLQGYYGTIGSLNDPPEWGNDLNAIYPFNMCGAYFTGLSKQYTTLRLRYRVYVEILADPCDNTLTPLATPTIPFNQSTNELVMKVIADLPPGVPQSWNPAGEKWRDVLRATAKVMNKLSPIVTSINPNAGLIMSGIGSAAGGVANVIPKKKKKKAAPKASPKNGAGAPRK